VLLGLTVEEVSGLSFVDADATGVVLLNIDGPAGAARDLLVDAVLPG
jgi:hypothetical protein